MLQFIAPLITDQRTIYVVATILILWAVVSAVFLLRGVGQLRGELRRSRGEIETAANAPSFRPQFEATFSALSSRQRLGSRWQEFRNSLLIPKRPGAIIQSTVRPATWFDLSELLRAFGVSPRYHAALPNLLVGAGLLFTFLGLAVALNAAGGIVGGTEAQGRNDALKNLLDTAAFKFITSLVGLMMSIAYALFRNRQLKKAEFELDRLLAAIELRMPLVTPAALQQEANDLLEQQSTQFATFSTELAVNIGTAFDRAFDQRLGEHIGPLAEAVKSLSEKLADQNESAMQNMLEAFLERLQGGAGERMQDVANSLAGLGSRLEGLQTSLGEAAVRMSQSADAMATRMGEGAEAALGRITSQMGSLVETLRAVADDVRKSGDQAGQSMSDQIGKAAAGFENAARSVAETLSTAAAAMEKRMTDEAAASSGRLTTQLETMVQELRALSEASQKAGTAAFERLAEQLASATGKFEVTAQRVAETLERAADSSSGAFGKGADEAVRRIAEATEGMRSELQAMLAELKGAFASAGDSVRSGAAAGSDALRESMQEAGSGISTAIAAAADSLARAGEAASTSLRSGAEAAADKMGEGATAIALRADAMATRARELGDGAGHLASRIGELDRIVRDAATPLSTSTQDLKAAAEAARDSGKIMLDSIGLMRTAFEQLAGMLQRLEGAHASAQRLNDAIGAASARFENVDKALAGTVDQLTRGLAGFTDQVRKFVSGIDSDLAKAVNQLAAFTNNLESTLDDFLEQLSKK